MPDPHCHTCVLSYLVQATLCMCVHVYAQEGHEVATVLVSWETLLVIHHK